MKITLELKRAVLGVLPEAGRRPMSPEALATYANAQMDAPVTAEQVRAALAELEQLGMVQRRASVLDPTALTWRATEAGMREPGIKLATYRKRVWPMATLFARLNATRIASVITMLAAKNRICPL